MTGKGLASLVRGIGDNKVLLLGFVVSLLYWFIESVMDTLVHHEDFTERLWPEDPNELWMRFTVVTLLVASSGFAQFLISRQERTERSLRKSEERYRQAFEKTRAVKLMIDPGSGAILDANQAACGYHGYRLEDLRAKNIADLNTLPSDRLAEEMSRARAEECG